MEVPILVKEYLWTIKSLVFHAGLFYFTYPCLTFMPSVIVRYSSCLHVFIAVQGKFFNYLCRKDIVSLKFHFRSKQLIWHNL